MRACLFGCLLAVGLLGLSGCGPAVLDETKTYTLEAGDPKAIDPPKQSKPQTITVEYTSTATEVSVGVFNLADAKDLNMVQYPKAIKSETGKKSGTFTADVPANTEYRVVFESRAKTELKLHVTNKK